MKKAASASDPLWYKDAIIYELHVRAFADANGDGIGDFAGLMGKLDYLQELGVTCLWLLPFFPSPGRDDGYDIADYVDVNPSYGTLDDFKQFLNAAHQRGMQVMIELVINHTSDQHPWFQKARHAAAGSPEREFYVWSATDQLYKDARIIFTDTEKSNWTWDDTAQAYYWHRFFSHQPDLNFDNPAVIEEVLKAMRFWLDMGVDALRMDAIPYLVERDGTSCENLPETHVAIKKIRAAIDAEYSNRLILAEANQWPADVRPYFGDGDECHMAFHFPLMPRIYMALRQEDRLPITEIMAQTPAIPDNCQWGLFLRNHDELTLEMVTDDERDYMYLAYSADPRMRINVGIRRRLAPLVDNNRRRIELLNSLLFSFPGTPIMYYGDEIGMGDNIYLGDRNGVRTPMQWNSDRNAGFSKAVPARLYSPVIMDPIWGYQAINVEAQQSDPSSLLQWTHNMIALRKLFQVFGRGTQEFLSPENRKILAYTREYDGEKVLCVANLSRFAQPVSLDLSKFEGMQPVEMLGYVPFPVITKEPYPLTLAPYAFFWLELQPASARRVGASQNVVPVEAMLAGEAVAPELKAAELIEIFSGPAKVALEKEFLPRFLAAQRWFGSKSRKIVSAKIVDHARLGGLAAELVMVEVKFAQGEPESYLVPLAVSSGPEAEAVRVASPDAVVAALPDGAVLHDATLREDFRQAMLHAIQHDEKTSGEHGAFDGRSTAALSAAAAGEMPASRRGTAEQSNTSLLFGTRFILKLLRRVEVGANPDVEVTCFLSETAHFDRIAPLLGEVRYASTAGETTSVAMLQPLIENEGDGWQWTQEELLRYYEICMADAHTTSPADARVCEHAALYLRAAAQLGQRTAEMHLALATPTDDTAFRAEPFKPHDLAADAERISNQINRALDALERASITAATDDAKRVLASRNELLARAQALREIDPENAGQRIRIHGDYHLGQLLRAKGDFVILDFEGEPARTLAERRRKQSPMRDVAGMLRSFSYAAFSGLDSFVARRPQAVQPLEPWADQWQQSAAREFLTAYTETLSANAALAPKPREARALLDAYLLDKALYELLYELNNRPAWVHIPLTGILALLQSHDAAEGED